jgi:DNA-binding MarR family transcriptional regulator
MLNNKIFRNTQIYLDKVLNQYDISSGSIPYLFLLEKHEGISQNKLSRKIGNDKAMATRTIKRLMEQNFVYKLADEQDSRAYQLFLTQKAKSILPKIHEEILQIVAMISADLTPEEKDVTLTAMKKIFIRTQHLRNEEE